MLQLVTKLPETAKVRNVLKKVLYSYCMSYSSFQCYLLMYQMLMLFIVRQAERVIMCIMLSEAGELSFVSTTLGWASEMFRKYGQGTCVQEITGTVLATTCFTAVNTELNGFPCVAHLVHRIVPGQHCD